MFELSIQIIHVDFTKYNISRSECFHNRIWLEILFLYHYQIRIIWHPKEAFLYHMYFRMVYANLVIHSQRVIHNYKNITLLVI